MLTILLYANGREAGAFWNVFFLVMLLQLYVSRQISTVGGTDGWTVRPSAERYSSQQIQPFTLYMPVRRGRIPAFVDMARDTLYAPYPGDRTQVPVKYLFYKRVNTIIPSSPGVDELHVIAVDLLSEPIAELSSVDLEMLYTALGLNMSASGIKLHYYHCPLQNAEKCTVKIADKKAHTLLTSTSIAHMPHIEYIPQEQTVEEKLEDGQNYDRDIDNGSSKGGRMKKWRDR